MNRTLRITIALAGLLAVGHAMAQTRSAETQFKAAQYKEEVEGDLKGAIEQYKKLAKDKDRAIAAKALVRMAECYEKLGQADAQKTYERVVREFSDQPESVNVARTRLATLRTSGNGQTTQTARIVWEIEAGAPVDPFESAPSADGRYLGFTDWGTGDLGIRDLTINTDRKLTNAGTSGDFAEASVISPDGRQIAYGWFDNKLARYELRVIPTIGTDSAQPQILYKDAETEYVAPFSWTPDGKAVLFATTRRDRTNHILSASVQGGTPRVLKSLSSNQFPTAAKVSPDGRYIAYQAISNGDRPSQDIFVLSIDGVRQTVAVQSAANDISPQWSPDGSQLLFFSDRTESRSLWVIRIEAGEPVGNPQFLKNMADISPLGLTRNGTLFYGSGGNTTNVQIAELDSNGKVSKGPTLALDRTVNHNLGASWSLDGRYLAYYSPRRSSGTSAVLVIHDVEFGEDREIPLRFNIPPNNPPRWFPDGRSVLMVVRESMREGLGYYRVDINSGKAEPLHYTNIRGAGARSPDLSPDGKAIFHLDRTSDGVVAVFRFDLDTGRTTELRRATATQGFHSFEVSPDGKQLVYVANDREPQSTWLEVIPTTGGQPIELLRGRSDGSLQNALTWSPDQRYVIFAKRPDSAKAESSIWRVSLTGRTAEPIGISLPVDIKSPAIRPNGRQIVFQTQEAGTVQVWALENFLPKAAARR